MKQIEATYIDHMGSDLSVVNAARVSFGKKSEFEGRVGGPNVLAERDAKLINYLAKHKHLSPFGHAFVSFHCQAPIYVARQLVKHKFLRWNEISRRYVDSEPEFYTPDVWRGRSEDKKQGSEGVVDTGSITNMGEPYEGNFGKETMKEYIEEESLLLGKFYERLLKVGVAPEMARMVLPQSTLTEWIWSGSLDAFADMCRLRCTSDTQAESQEVAWQIYHTMEELFPVSWVALMEDAY